MPELPEVEIARETLEGWLKGQRILDARVLDRRLVRGQRARRVEEVLRGARVRRIGRRGKFLIWDLAPSGRILAHLGMTGEFVLRERRELEPSAARLTLGLSRGRRVILRDPRRLGRFQVLHGQLRGILARLGVEPLSHEFTSLRLKQLLDGKRLPIKSFLMDQSRVAGLGNILASEALFRARLHPVRPAGRLSGEEIARLRRAIRAAARESLRRQRGAEIPYPQGRGERNPFLVYGRAGKPCPRCGAAIWRIVQSGRSTYYCSTCQPRRHRSKVRGRGVS